jgi:hypothetical protein
MTESTPKSRRWEAPKSPPGLPKYLELFRRMTSTIYAYMLKYRVLQTHRGKVQGDEILVAQYNPLKPRSGAQDELSGKVGGKPETFRAGDVHRMALASPVDQFWMGGIVDKYFETKGVRYWAIWTNPAKR